ncbi:MAG: hypothetical protein P8P98_02765 [Emcibacteraceae bacterium]|nr:hypothetical protein [Emcibacteraceae bacterium]MDG1996938.1 hypothetical protein [Emcibacteraceae bacterium]
MQKIFIAFLFLLSTLTVSNAQDRGMITPDDTASIDGVMKAYYEAVSGHPGKRDVARILNLYAPNAKLNVNVTGGKPVHGIVEEVVMGDRFQNINTEFFEREISRDEHRFGNLANVISTYGISDAMENTNYTARGITLFQMYYAGDRWWVLSSVWQRESDDLPLPKHLLD